MDDLQPARVKLETEAMLSILKNAKIESGYYSVVMSFGLKVTIQNLPLLGPSRILNVSRLSKGYPLVAQLAGV